MYKTFNKVKKIFKRPRLRFWLGKYQNSPVSIPKISKCFIYNSDVKYKEKYKSTYFDQPPCFVIYLFGFVLVWWLDSPGTAGSNNEANYWEAINIYISCQDIQTTDDIMGVEYIKWNNHIRKRHRLSCKFLKKMPAAYIAIKRWKEQTINQ